MPLEKSRVVPKPSAVRIQLSRLSEGGKAIAGAIPQPVKTASRHSIRFGGWAAAIFFALVFAAVAALYARLLTGPISFAFLVPSLQRQLNSQVNGYSFRVGDAILRLSGGWGLEFRLANVRLAGPDNQEIATAPFASVGISERALLGLSLAADEIKLLGPKVLIFNMPGKGFTLSVTPNTGRTAGAPTQQGWVTDEAPFAAAAPEVPAAEEEPREIAGVRQLARQGLTQPAALPFNPAPLLSRLFSALKSRGGASSALERVGVQDAVIYFANEKGVSTWRVADFHIDLAEERRESALKGQLTLEHGGMAWRASFHAVDLLQSKRYSVTASIDDIVPRTIWRSFPALDPLKLVDLPVSGEARFDISYEGQLLGGEGEIKLGSGQFFAPFDEKHPAVIDGGLLKVSYDKDHDALLIKPFELRWDEVS